METILRAAVFVNEADNQVRAAHKILGYDLIQRSFADPKYVIRANDPWLQRITIVEHRFLIPEGSPIPEGVPLAGSSSSHQAAEAESGSGLPEEGFDAFDQASSPADPVGDLCDPNLSEEDFLLAGTSSQAEMGLKRKPQSSLLDLIEGQPGKEAPGKSQSKPPPPLPQPQLVQTKSSPARSRTPSPRPKHPASPQSTLPPRPESTDSKRKRSSKGKEPMDEGKSHTPQEEGETP